MAEPGNAPDLSTGSEELSIDTLACPSLVMTSWLDSEKPFIKKALAKTGANASGINGSEKSAGMRSYSDLAGFRKKTMSRYPVGANSE
jgi:hypothetical protein